MKFAILLLTAVSLWGQSQVSIYSSKDIQKIGQALAQQRTRFASKDLARYASNYSMIAYREETGSSEVHQHESDIWIIETGTATLITGGKLTNPHTQKPGEIRGTSIQGGERHAVGVGDVVEIPPGVPHQVLIEKGKPFTYFVIKVTGQ